MLNEPMRGFRSVISVILVTGVILIARPPMIFGNPGAHDMQPYSPPWENTTKNGLWKDLTFEEFKNREDSEIGGIGDFPGTRDSIPSFLARKMTTRGIFPTEPVYPDIEDTSPTKNNTVLKPALGLKSRTLDLFGILAITEDPAKDASFWYYIVAILVPFLSAVLSILTRKLKEPSEGVSSCVLMFWLGIGALVVGFGGKIKSPLSFLQHP